MLVSILCALLVLPTEEGDRFEMALLHESLDKRSRAPSCRSDATTYSGVGKLGSSTPWHADDFFARGASIAR